MISTFSLAILPHLLVLSIFSPITYISFSSLFLLIAIFWNLPFLIQSAKEDHFQVSIEYFLSLSPVYIIWFAPMPQYTKGIIPLLDHTKTPGEPLDHGFLRNQTGEHPRYIVNPPQGPSIAEHHIYNMINICQLVAEKRILMM